MKNKNLIIIPFAYLKEYNGGVNIKDENKKLDTYLKNCCVSCVSAKKKCRYGYGCSISFKFLNS
mgnify:CR=1 FL=1